MFTDAALAQEFILAGSAIVTLRSRRTGAHYTFRVRASSGGSAHFVTQLVAPDQYEYLAAIIDGELRLTRKSPAEPTRPILAFAFMWNWLKQGVIPSDLELYHEGRCGRCGRPLTNPDSINRGIGPECSKFSATSC